MKNKSCSTIDISA